MTETLHPLSEAEISRQVKSLIRSSGDIKAVCFDFFDTLVHRSIAPEHTKRIASRRLAEMLGMEISGTTLYELRRDLEARLCRENLLENGENEFSLILLASGMFDILHSLDPSAVQDTEPAEFSDLFCRLEVAVEKLVQTLNPAMVELLTWLHARGVATFLVSDFYVPEQYYRMFLSAHGLETLFDDLYISVERGKSKGSGSLYGLIKERCECNYTNLLMIGDNEHADYNIPKELGIQAFLLDVSEKRSFYRHWEQENQAAAGPLLKSRFQDALRIHTATYFPEMGLSLWLFVHRLTRQLIRNKTRDVFFCSKEGEFLLRLFEQYQSMLFGRIIVAPHYLVVSRKATFIASLKPLQDETFERLFEQYRDLSIEEFLLSLNYSRSEVAELCSNIESDTSQRIFDLRNSQVFAELLASAHFQECFEKHRVQQQNKLLGYLGSFPADLEREGITLVDVGWKGSIQNNLYHALAGNVPVSGYYIGLLSPSHVSETNRKGGILFSDVPGHSPFIHVFNNNRSLFEMTLGASHGSADGYFSRDHYQEVKEDRGSTSFYPPETDSDSVVSVLDLPDERHLFNKQIRPLQDCYLELCKDLTSAYGSTDGEGPPINWFARHHARMVFKPTTEEVEFYSRLYHLENFGLFEFTSFGAGPRPSLGERLRNLVMLLKDPAAVLETGTWPPIILKRLGLSFLQPVDGRKRFRRIFQGDSE